MEQAGTSTPEHQNPLPQTTTTTHHLSLPLGLTKHEFNQLKTFVSIFHTYHLSPSQCSSLLAQDIHASVDVVWSVVRRFDKPQTYNHFIKSCTIGENFKMEVGCTRDVNVISGLPAATSTAWLDLLDDDNHVMAFTIIGGEYRLRNYHAVTTVHEVVTGVGWVEGDGGSGGGGGGDELKGENRSQWVLKRGGRTGDGFLFLLIIQG
ncbi:putative polyketide cyclase/dehydrase, START-like domain superfamily [Helianthus annuus]|nr:putative polyketide cyclase/dehydrase, START-like domain superfamily [Helianthus annuus]